MVEIKAAEKFREVDIVELFQVLWRGKWLIAGITAVAVLAMFIINLLVPAVPVYKERAVVQLTTGIKYGRSDIVGRTLHSDEFVAAVSEKIKGYSAGELYEISQQLLSQKEVSFETLVDGRPIISSEVIELTIQGTNPDLIHTWIIAALDELQLRSEAHYAKRRQLKEEYLDNLQIQLTQVEWSIEETQRGLDQLDPNQEDLRHSLNAQLAQLLQLQGSDLNAQYQLSMDLEEDLPFKILTAPCKPAEASQASFVRPNLLVAAVLGIVLGIVAVFVRDYIKALLAAKNK